MLQLKMKHPKQFYTLEKKKKKLGMKYQGMESQVQEE